MTSIEKTPGLLERNRGFTILEMIIVVAIIAVVSLVTAPLGIQFYNTQLVNSLEGQLGDTLTRARSQSVVQKGDSQYGVCLNSSSGYTPSFVLYQGATGTPCASHNTSYDENYPILSSALLTFPSSTPPTGIPEINFSKHTGTPSATGTITIVWNGITKTMTVDNLGTVVEN